MARPLRIEYDGAWYHVINRGAARKDIFYKDEHREIFLSLLDQILQKYKIEIHAYCLMTNHYHLLVHTPLANLHKGMRHLNSIYAQQLNKAIDIDGPLFRGRYKSILVEEDEYLLQLSRYIHLNPTEAKLCHLPEDYPWSSYKYYLNKSQRPSWLHCNKILEYFYSNDMNETLAYQDFINDGLDDKISDFLTSPKIPILGSRNFIKNIKNKYLNDKIISKEIPERKNLEKLFIPSAEAIIEFVARFYNVNTNEVISFKKGKYNYVRAIAIFIAVETCQMDLQRLGSYFGKITRNGISNSYNRLLEKTKTDLRLKQQINDLKKWILESHMGNGAM